MIRRLPLVLTVAALKATFFEIGQNVARYPHVTRRIDQAGYTPRCLRPQYGATNSAVAALPTILRTLKARGYSFYLLWCTQVRIEP